ncbi:GrpB family protein [Allobacillus sp. GCM10007491]|uniref:GrpB family protein n=1 Tax=Allobacillus TaxID=1400133 RepID=UPI0030135EA9
MGCSLIDIVVGVDDLATVDKPLLKGLSKADFLRLKVKRPDEIVLAKFTDDTYEKKTHFIHLVEYHKDLWKNLIYFRDYLNSNPEAREEYLELKKEYLKQSSTAVSDYTNHKVKFVKSIFWKENG